MKKRIVGLLAALGVASPAPASIFGDAIVGGNACDRTNVDVQTIGDALVVLLAGLGVDMPFFEYGDGLAVRKTCNVRVAVDVPAGYRLRRLRQIYSGGIVKTAGTSARIQLRHNVGALMTKAEPIVFEEGTEIYADEPASLFERDLSVELPDAECGADTTYGLNVQVAAARHDYFEVLLGGLDYVVSGFVQRVRLKPELEPCDADHRR